MISRLRLLKMAALAVIFTGLFAWIATAQVGRVSGLTRCTATTGCNDSARVELADSATRSRAATIATLRTAILGNDLQFKTDSAWNIGGSLTTLRPKKLWLADTAFTGVHSLNGGIYFRTDSGFNIGTSLTAGRPKKGWFADTVFAGRFKGPLTGSVTGLADSATGAARAQILTTARALWSLNFNGSAAVTGMPRFTNSWASNGRDSLLAGSALAFAANDTVYGTPTWNAAQTFAAGQRVDSATGAARSQTLTTARTIWGQSFNGSATVSGALTGVTTINASSNITEANNAFFQATRADAVSLVGVIGIDANDTLRVGTALVPMVLRHTGVLFTGTALAAEGASKNAVCVDGTTGQFFQNASVTCTVSSARFKEYIESLPLADARRIMGALVSSQYDEIETHRPAIGIVAEQADSVDHRLASRDASGLITSTNYEQVTTVLLRVVQDQDTQLRALRALICAEPRHRRELVCN